MLHALVQNSKVISRAGKTIAVPWWSFTKTVIATAALVLVRDKLLALDQTLENQLFTLRQLLRHEAGLADYGQLPDYHLAVERGDAPWSDEEMLERTEAKRLRYLPGSSWAYSNIGYLYVRRLIEHRTGEDLEVALQRLVLRPLELNHVRLAKSHQDLIDVEMGVANTYDPRWVYHGLLVGPLHEAALLLDRLMAGSLLPEDLLGDMLERRSLGGSIAGRPWVSPGYGLGIMVGTTEDETSIAGHTGGGPGSFIAVYRNIASPLSPCCAAFSTGGEVGNVEREAIRRVEQYRLSNGGS
ncbi:Beta-lactamase [Nitrosospira multiformis]|uniref:Beta-lactamase n=1 Tax=Nitrosospira multiformis TaxID=1231 RepID=A0A1H8BPJ9_9PROT|nr:serine hydrolase domain-containing protein [Nitrosospira multiformis]SEM84765.1 Beta-lactamase [Nitrosospira multiformis]